MTDQRAFWDQLVAEYLERAQRALRQTGHPRHSVVLDDLRDHLRERFNDLPEGEREPDRMRAIISEMGEPAEYVDLLAPPMQGEQRQLSWRLLWRSPQVACMVAIVLAGAALVSFVFWPLAVLLSLQILLRLAVVIFVVVAGIWAYRRFRLPSVPWMLTYFLLGDLPGLGTVRAHVAQRVMDQMMASGRTPFGSGMTIGEFLGAMTAISSTLAGLATALIVWFFLAEVAFAYSKSSATSGIPAVVLAPRRHPYVVGVAMIGCRLAMTAFWFLCGLSV